VNIKNTSVTALATTRCNSIPNETTRTNRLMQLKSLAYSISSLSTTNPRSACKH